MKVARKKIIGFISLVLIIGVLVGVGFVVYRMMSGPAEGTVTNMLPQQAVSAEPVIELEQFDGRLYSFAHPSNYTERKVKDPPTSSLETEQFVASGVVNKLVTISVSSLPSGHLDDDASYHMRSIHPDVYKITKQQLQGETVMVALNTQDYQQAAFWVHGGKLLTFAISSIDMDTGTTGKEYQQMLESIRWR